MTFELQRQLKEARLEYLRKTHKMLDTLGEVIDQKIPITFTPEEASFLFLVLAQSVKCEACLQVWEQNGLTKTGPTL